MRARAWKGLLLAMSLLAATPAHAVAQQPPPPAATQQAPSAPPAEPVSPDSPRAAVKNFLDLCRVGEYAEAARYLDLSDAQKPEGAQLARRLKAVLDRQIWVNPENLSPRAQGYSESGVPQGAQEIGTIPGPKGLEPVRLVRRPQEDGLRWVFSRNTVDHIDAWYSRLSDRWLHDYLPEQLLRAGPRDLLYWQWIALPVLFLLALLAGRLLGWITRLALGRVMTRAKGSWNEARLKRLGGPLTLLWAIEAIYLALPELALYPPAHAFILRVLRTATFVGLFWLVERGIDVAAARLLGLPAAKGNSAARSLVPLGARVLKVGVVAIAAVAFFSLLGYPVVSLVAGFGVGGIAIALAAQKTVEHLFGSLAIGIDQPFRVGDAITVEGLSGIVESVGLRSTRIRTMDRTLVTIPNGKLADMRIESFAARDRTKLACVLALDRSTSPEAVGAVIERVRSTLKAQPKIWPDVSVALTKVRPDAFEVEVLAWFQTTSWDEFLKLRQDALLGLVRVIDEAGIKLTAALGGS